jgi:MFS family permease
VNLWGALVYAVGGRVADRYNARYLVIVTCIPFGIAGYAILLAFDVPVGVLYFATFLIATPCFLCTGSNIAWLSSNCAPDGKRAASLGFQLTLTNLGGIIAGQIYQSTSAPRFVLGHSWSLGSLAIAFIGCSIMRVVYVRRDNWKNEAKIKIEQGEEPDVPKLWVSTDRGLSFKYLV